MTEQLVGRVYTYLGIAGSASSQRSGKSTGWSVGSQRSGIAESVS